jgi:AcrR family transcriptional regulator
VVDREPDGGESDPGPARLPRGRHGLPREIVAENQRQRLIAATVGAVAEHGYNETTVSSIIKAAGLSRATFYQLFTDREACFTAAYEATLADLRQTALGAPAPGEQWPERVRAALAALLAALAANPERARLFLVAPATVGDQALERHHRALRDLIGDLIATPPGPPASPRPSEAREQALAGGLSGLIVRKIQAGEEGQLPDLLPALSELLFRPYLGEDAAIRLARSEQRSGP